MRLLFALLAVALVLTPMSAHAHGRPPVVGQVRFHPTDPDFVLARATWGLVLTEDGGASWRWICAAVTGIDPTREDPATLVAPDGALLVAGFAGLSRSTPERCDFEFVEELRDVYVIDLHARLGDPSTIWAVVTDGAGPDRVHRSDDGGLSFSPLGPPIDNVLLERVRVAPSDAMRVYLSGAIPARSGAIDAGVEVDGGVVNDGGTVTLPRRAFFLRSLDGGSSYEPILMFLEGEERNVHLLAVDPTNADRVLVRMTRRSIDPLPERVLLTEDGGDTWTTAMSARWISGGEFTADGATAYVTSTNLDGLWRSDDAGRSFAQVQTLSMPCLGVRDGEVWTCVDELRDGFAMGRSSDRGVTLEPVLRFDDIGELPDCPACSEVGYVCPGWFPDVVADLRLDAGGLDLPDGGTGRPRDAAPPITCLDATISLDAGVGMDGDLADAGPGGGGDGCGCRASGSGRSSPALAAILIALVVSLRRRRRAQ